MDNPYQTTPPPAYPPNSQELVATQQAVTELANCKGWVRFISVLCFTLFGIFVLGFIGILYMVSQWGGAPAPRMLIMYLAFIFITFFLAFRLTGYANAIGRLINNRHPIDLETAMIHQLKFWRLYGIIMIVSLVIKIFTL